MNELITATAAEQAAALAAGEVSSRELTQAHLERIAVVDDAVNAFLDVDADKALADADAADAARREGECNHDGDEDRAHAVGKARNRCL